MSLITKLFGTSSERAVKKLVPIIDQIEALDEKFSAMSEKELKDMTNVLKGRLEKGETLDDILPEAFATVREAAWRVLGMKHFPVQIMGGIVLHHVYASQSGAVGNDGGSGMGMHGTVMIIAVEYIISGQGLDDFRQQSILTGMWIVAVIDSQTGMISYDQSGDF